MKDVNYWEIEHLTNWDRGIKGRFQTAVFAAQALANFDIRHWEKLWNAKTLIDVGCAWGQAGGLFSGVFPSLIVTGVDFSKEACKKARNYCPTELNVVNYDFRDTTSVYDIVYCSQLLAFENDPGTMLNHLEERADKMMILVVPYDQNLEGRVTEPVEGHEPGGHVSGLTRKDFPKFLGKFERTVFKILEKTEVCHIPQALIIYELIDEQTKKDIQFKDKQLDEWYEYLMQR